ncbi:MAG: hypothetical protein IJS90_02590 [Clostridia bacterium]|nr:hypothetical protein [Clostridia bacterium]
MTDSFEEKKLKETREFIDRKIGELSAEISKKRESIERRNRDFLADNPFGSVYGAADDTIRKNESELETAEKNRRDIAVLTKLKKEPYFGRVDFFYDDENEEEKIYVGLKNLMDGHDILVYDWRAPVSSLFYTGELGRASYHAPAGEITGEIKLLRQYSYTSNGDVRFWDTELHIDDDVLRGVLSGASSDKMRPIVCTIQREQNAAIRFSPKENLAVFGPAGSGKTSVGMHRLAWLMYRAHTEGYAVSTLMFSSNEAFGSYISGVLPELGEVNTSFFSFPELFSRYLGGFSVESALSQTENVISGVRERAENVSLLYSPGFCSFVENRLSSLSGNFKTVNVIGQEALSKEEIEKKFSSASKKLSVTERLSLVADWVYDELQNYLLINRKNILSYLLEHVAPGESYTESYTRLKKQVLEGSKQMVLSSVPSDPARLLFRMLREYYGENEKVRGIILRVGRRDVFFEEAVMLLYIAALLGVCRPFSSPTHVLIDEAQDMCFLQLKTIKLLFPKAVFTVLGDVSQGITPELNTLSPDAIAGIYGASKIFLSKSYRSTTQICAYAKRFLLPEAAYHEVFDREGKPVETLETDDPVKTCAGIMELSSKKPGFTCVILKTVKEARAFYKKLVSFVPSAQLIDSENRAMTEKVLVMPAALAKGLEFDRVILPIKKSAPPSDRIMYLSSTRALHELYIIYFK